MSKHQSTRELLGRLRAERDALAQGVAPLRAERDALAQGIAPAQAKIREIEKMIRAVEQPRLAELDNEIAALARALGARVMSRPDREVAGEAVAAPGAGGA